MSNKDIEIDNSVIAIYNQLNKEYHFKINQKNKNNVDYIIKVVREKMLSLGYNEIDITDMLVKYLYGTKKTSHKEILWSCFGEVIVENLKNNIPIGSIQCEKCGCRFIKKVYNQKLCDTCSTYQPIGTKTITCIDCGKEVEVDAKDTKTNRCDRCYKAYRTEYYRLNKQKQREKAKMSTDQFQS